MRWGSDGNKEPPFSGNRLGDRRDRGRGDLFAALAGRPAVHPPFSNSAYFPLVASEKEKEKE